MEGLGYRGRARNNTDIRTFITRIRRGTELPGFRSLCNPVGVAAAPTFELNLPACMCVLRLAQVIEEHVGPVAAFFRRVKGRAYEMEPLQIEQGHRVNLRCRPDIYYCTRNDLRDLTEVLEHQHTTHQVHAVHDREAAEEALAYLFGRGPMPAQPEPSVPVETQQDPSPGNVMPTSPFPSTACLQCDNPGCVFFIDGCHQRVPFETRERRILDFQCPACGAYIKIRARTERSAGSVRRFIV